MGFAAAVVAQPGVVLGAAQLFDGEEVDMPSKAAVGESQARVAGDLADIDTSFG